MNSIIIIITPQTHTTNRFYTNAIFSDIMSSLIFFNIKYFENFTYLFIYLVNIKKWNYVNVCIIDL